MEQSPALTGGRARESCGAAPAVRELPVRFVGDAREYFRVWIVNTCLSLLTFGLFLPWAKVRSRRYFYAHTLLEGTPFQYLGEPIALLKGRLLAVLFVIVWFVTFNVWGHFAFLVLLAALALLPWVLVRSAAFTAHCSSFRNLRFHFGGTPGGLAAPLYGWALATVLSCGLALPYLRHALSRYFVERTSFGGVRARLRLGRRAFLRMYLPVLVGVPLAGAFFAALATAGALGERDEYFLTVTGYTSWFVAFTYLRARVTNLVWNNIALGPLRFRSTLSARALLWLYVTNALAMVVSLGLLVPWAKIRSARYRADQLKVLQHGSWTAFEGSRAASVHGAGDEIAESFELGVVL